MFVLSLYFLLALGVSFLCSLLEAVLLSLSGSHIALMVEKKKAYAGLLQYQKDNITRPLSAILTLNTIAHTLGAAGVGAQVAILFGNEYVAAASGILTFLVLLFSEVIPKTLGATYAKELASISAFMIQGLSYFLFPAVLLLDYISKFLGKSAQAKISRDEIRALSHLAESEGSLSKRESEVIRNLLALRTMRVHQIMTPLSVVFSFPNSAQIGNIVSKNRSIPFARIPLYEGAKDNIVGMVIRFHILGAYRDGNLERTVGSFKQTVNTISANESISELLNQFFLMQEQLFVVEEHDKTVGIVTLEDALETLLDVEIVDETDRVVDMRELAKRLEKMRTARQKAARGYSTKYDESID